MSEIRKCKTCGEPRYMQGNGSHLETGRLECAPAVPVIPFHSHADGTRHPDERCDDCGPAGPLPDPFEWDDTWGFVNLPDDMG